MRTGLVRVAFLVLIAYVWYEGHSIGSGSAREQAAAKAGLRFREVAHEVGIDFVHRATRVDSQVDNIAAQITAVGAAVSVTDFDGDRRPDLFALTSAMGESSALYRNLGDGRFEDVAERVGLADLNRPGTGCAMGSVWADFDSDGREDVFVYKWGQGQLFRNEASSGGEPFFRDVTPGSGLEGWINSNAATWFDYDADGVLDLYVTGYFADEHDLWNLATTRIMQDSFEFSSNGGHNRLFRGMGDGTFEDVTEATGTDSTRWTYAAVAADFDRDGWTDLYLANDYGPEELLLNQGGERFELARGIGLEAESKSGMCVALGDVLGEGRPSVFVTNISKAGYLFQGNNLRVSLLDRDGPMLQLAEGSVADCGWAWGAQFGDLDDDGLQDLVVVNGFISASQERDYWYQMSKIGLSTGSVIADAAKWPAIEDRSLSGYERTRVLLKASPRGARFQEVGREVGVDDVFDGRAVVLADLFGTGRLDVVIANQNGPLLVYRNESDHDNHWVGFDLTGTESNRSAIGAEIELEFAGRKQLQVVTSACGFASQNDRRQHFGLGKDPGPVQATIRWPSGARLLIPDLELDRMHVIVESE